MGQPKSLPLRHLRTCLGLSLGAALAISCANGAPLASGPGQSPLRFVVAAPDAPAATGPDRTPPGPNESGSTSGGASAPGGGPPESPTPGPGASQGPALAGGGGGGGPLAPAPQVSEFPTPNPASPTPTPDPAQPPACEGPCNLGPRQGQAVDQAGQAIPGARFLRGGVALVADAQGQVSLPAPASNQEVVVVQADGYLSSALAGWHEGRLAVHLQPLASGGEAFPSQSSFEVVGRILGVDGQALPGASVVASNAQGVEGGPALTDAQGRYRLQLNQLPEGRALQVVLWAYQSGANGNAAALGHARFSEVQAGQDLGSLRLEAPSSSVRLAQALNPPFSAQATWRLWAVDPTGPRIAFASPTQGRLEAPSFLLPGCRLELEAQAQGRGSVSLFRQDLGASDALVSVAFLRPPEPQNDFPWSPGSEWRWRPIPEATGYRVEGPDWEAFSTLPRWLLPSGLGDAPTTVRIVATTESGGLRSLAQAPTGPRALRRFVEPSRWSAWEGPLAP